MTWKSKIRTFRGLTTIQFLTLGFLILSVIGALLLMLPISIRGLNQIAFIDALFTAASAITTTGLGVVDTGSYFSIFGQVVIIILVQIGGLGYMIFISLLMAGFKNRLSFKSRDLLHQSIGSPSTEEILNFSKKVILFTLFFEITGAIMLAGFWSQYYPGEKSIYFGVFHSVSAFCTAGFALLPDGFISFRNSIYFNLVINLLCIAGSVGFYVLNDTYVYGKQKIQKKYPRNFSAHSKLAVYILLALIVIGTTFVFFTPGDIMATSSKERWNNSAFQIISASTTTGFNTINIGSMANPALWLIMILMFIGSGPGSTGGGIKTTTFGIILLSVRSTLKGKQDINIFKRSAPPEMIMKAFSVTIIAFMWIAISMCILLVTESGLSFQSILFEITSAFGTVGLSTGITSSLSDTGKIITILTMLLGRIGPVALGYSLMGNSVPKNYKYPKADILIG